MMFTDTRPERSVVTKREPSTRPILSAKIDGLLASGAADPLSHIVLSISEVGFAAVSSITNKRISTFTPGTGSPVASVMTNSIACFDASRGAKTWLLPSKASKRAEPLVWVSLQPENTSVTSAIKRTTKEELFLRFVKIVMLRRSDAIVQRPPPLY